MMIGWLFIGIIVYFIFKEKGESLTLINKDNAQIRLKERFVNGEIDEQTYLRMKSII